MKEVYTLDDLEAWLVDGCPLDPVPRFAVIGDPVEHSASPAMHQAAFQELDMPEQYIRVHVVADQVERAIKTFANAGFLGVNVTIPHKVAVAEAVDEVEPLAQKIGAVNTILFSEGKTVGFNSDAPGFRQAIREAFSVDLSDLQIMLLGAAGGAGMAATYQCAEERCERLVLVNRTRSKAEALAKELEPSLTKGRFVGPVPRLEVISWEDEEAIGQALDHVDLVVNCTNVGMKRSDPPLLPRNVLQPHHLLFDMVYQPARTTFLKDGEGEGARTGNGLGMLLWQGVISFEYWLNVQPPVEAMRKALQASL